MDQERRSRPAAPARPPQAERTAPSSGGSALADLRAQAEPRRALAQAARTGPAIVAQREALGRLFGDAARFNGALTPAPLQARADSGGVVQLGNKSGRERQDEKEKEEKKGSEGKNPSSSETQKDYFAESGDILLKLASEFPKLPPTFEIAAAGSFGRRELTAKSDLDIFFVVAEDCDRESAEQVRALCQRYAQVMLETYGVVVEIEQSGTVAYIKKMDAKGNFGRDVRLLYEAGGAGLAQQVSVLTGNEVEGIVDEVAMKLNQAMETNKASDPIEIKAQLYRPLHLYARLLAHAFGLSGSANSLDIIAAVAHQTGARSLLNDLKAALIVVNELRTGDNAALDPGGSTKSLRKSIIGKLFPRLLSALGAFQKSKKALSLVQ